MLSACRLAGEKGVEFARVFEGVEVITATDVGRADEDLRHRLAAVRALDHFVAALRLAADIDTFVLHAFGIEQAVRALAVGSGRFEIHGDGLHGRPRV